MPYQTESQISKNLKTCSTCRLELPVNSFYSAINRVDKLTSQCKGCNKLHRMANMESLVKKTIKWQKEHREEKNAIDKKYRDSHKEEISESRKKYYINNKLKVKNSRLIRERGITLEQRDQMLKDQMGVCKICKSNECGGYDWATDHDHKTGLIRGILCNHCNKMLGMVKDNPEILKSAIEYLSHSSFPNPPETL